MKVKAIWSAMLIAALASCSQDVIYDSNDDLQNKYMQSWIKKFGLIDENHNWNMSTLIEAEVDPVSFGKNTTVKIYENNTNKGNRLIGITNKRTKLNLDVVKGTETVYAMVLEGKNVIAEGIYDINKGKVAINKSAKFKSPVFSRGTDDEEDNTTYFDWTIACEDLGTVGDYDFNDIVIGINHVAGTGIVKVTALACGGTIAADVYVCGTRVGEIHELVKENTPVTRMINTFSWSRIGKTETVTVDPKWNISTNMGDIEIKVKGKEATVKAPATGTAPQMICIKGDWLWPVENKHITGAYPNFSKYNQNAEDLSWLEDAEIDNVIDWISDPKLEKPTEPELDPDPNTDPDPATPTPDLSIRMIEANGADWSVDWSTNTTNNKNKKTWDYVPGLVTKAMLAYCEQYDEFDETAGSVYYNCKQYADKGLTDSGLKSGVFVEGSLDNIASGKVLLSLYRQTNDTKYKNAAKDMYTYLSESYPTTSDGGFYHKVSEYPDQMWLDGLYMGAAFMAEYVATFPEEFNTDTKLNAAWNKIYDQFRIIHSHTYNSQLKLNYHAWSGATSDNKSFWAKKDGDGDTNPYRKTGCSPEFWGRGMGWYIAALVDVLDYMPESYANYNNLKQIFQNVAEGVKNCQDKTSWAWYQLLQYGSDVQGLKWDGRKYKNGAFNTTYNWDNGVQTSSDYVTFGYTIDGGNTNYLEASASCMFTYALLKGLRLGLLSESDYRTCADNAYEQGIQNNFIRTDKNGTYVGRDYDGNKEFTLEKDFNIVNICKSAGLGGLNSDESVKKYRDGSISYYLNGKDAADVVANEGKGIGPFIFASLEYELAHPTE